MTYLDPLTFEDSAKIAASSEAFAFLARYADTICVGTPPKEQASVAGAAANVHHEKQRILDNRLDILKRRHMEEAIDRMAEQAYHHMRYAQPEDLRQGPADYFLILELTSPIDPATEDEDSPLPVLEGDPDQCN